jgi:hypothetical protein
MNLERIESRIKSELLEASCGDFYPQWCLEEGPVRTSLGTRKPRACYKKTNSCERDLVPLRSIDLNEARPALAQIRPSRVSDNSEVFNFVMRRRENHLKQARDRDQHQQHRDRLKSERGEEKGLSILLKRRLPRVRRKEISYEGLSKIMK